MTSGARGGRALTGVRRWLQSVRPRRADLKADVVAGLPGAISSVPDGMAASVLAGISPVHGLYASFAGPIAGGLTSSSRLMVITTTSAAALAAGSALESTPADQRPGAVILLTIVAGLVLAAAALLGVGRFVRFVSHSVMLGFLTGIGVNIVLSQIPDLLGVSASGGVALTKAVDALTHPSEIDLATLGIGVIALAILVLLGRTRLGAFSSLIALVVPTVLLVAVQADSVARVSDAGAIPAGLPKPVVPDLSTFTSGVLVGALSVAAIVLVQGAGVAESAPNPDGSRARTGQDIMAQGAANVAAGVFGGQPVGGSVGQTAMNVSVGARSRWGAIWSGIWMLLILVALSGVVGLVAMPTLAAVLIYAAVGSFRPREVMSLLRAGRTAQIAFVTTFAATLALPVAAAVGIGVAISLLLQLNQETLDLRLVRLLPDSAGRFSEAPVPSTLADGDVVVLQVYGSLFYAGARTLQRKLPDPAGSHGAAVVLRLRGRTSLGATFFTVIGAYAERLSAADGQLLLSGVDGELAEQWEADGLPMRAAGVQLFPATPTILESTFQAFLGAQSRVVRASAPSGD